LSVSVLEATGWFVGLARLQKVSAGFVPAPSGAFTIETEVSAFCRS
jgi:hypothetical protein